jgi:hypothetical protein
MKETSIAMKAGMGWPGVRSSPGVRRRALVRSRRVTRGSSRSFLSDLSVAGVDGEDRLCAALQNAVGEASGGGSYVDAGEISEVDGPVGEGALEFEAAAADVFEIGAKEADNGVR